MHYLPLMMHSDTAAGSLQSPFYYAYDGRDLAVCFCTEKEFALEQLEVSRQQHFTEEYVESINGHWGLGVIEFGSIDQIMLFIRKWDVLVQVKTGWVKPTAVALWKADEPHRFIRFSDIEKQIAQTSKENTNA